MAYEADHDHIVLAEMESTGRISQRAGNIF